MVRHRGGSGGAGEHDDYAGRDDRGIEAALWAYLAGSIGNTRDGVYVRVVEPLRPSDALPAPRTPSAVVPAVEGDIRAQFFAGYRSAGGPAIYEDRLVRVIDCESGWQLYPPANGYVSMAQFTPYSWNRAGGGDPHDAYTVGRNVAVWISLIADPGSTSGWPVCWWE